MSLFSLPNTTRYVDATNWSINNSAATPLNINGAQTLNIGGTPATTVYLAIDDLKVGQQFYIVNNSTQAVRFITSYVQGVSTIWTQNGTSFTSMGGGGSWTPVLFNVDSSGNANLYALLF